MAVEYSRGRKVLLAGSKVAVAALFGLLVAGAVGWQASWRVAPLLGWDAAALLFVGWTWRTVWPMDETLTASHAVREDPSRASADAVMLGAGVASLVAVGILLVDSGSAGSAKLWLAGLGILSVVIGWVVIHTLFALRYAELYYRGAPGGVEFAGAAQPSYRDFAYLAFTLGMTFQVSDTGFKSTEFRVTALRHSLISYVFGTIIVATTINLIAGLTK